MMAGPGIDCGSTQFTLEALRQILADIG